MISDEVFGEELEDNMLDVAHVGSVDDRLAQGVPQETLVLGDAVTWRARSRAGVCIRRWSARKSA